ncbi:unnamed protein product, partial [Mesorhabditis spiculigera]
MGDDSMQFPTIDKIPASDSATSTSNVKPIMTRPSNHGGGNMRSKETAKRKAEPGFSRDEVDEWEEELEDEDDYVSEMDDFIDDSAADDERALRRELDSACQQPVVPWCRFMPLEVVPESWWKKDHHLLNFLSNNGTRQLMAIASGKAAAPARIQEEKPSFSSSSNRPEAKPSSSVSHKMPTISASASATSSSHLKPHMPSSERLPERRSLEPSNALKVKEQLQLASDKLKEITQPDCPPCFKRASFVAYVEAMLNYYNLRSFMWEFLWVQHRVADARSAGRAVVVNTGRYGLGTRVAILVEMIADKLSVVIPCDKEELFVIKDVGIASHEEADVRALVLYGVDECVKRIGNYDGISMRLLELGPSSLVGICKNLFKLDGADIVAADLRKEAKMASRRKHRKHRLNEPYERLMHNLVQYTNTFSPFEYKELEDLVERKHSLIRATMLHVRAAHNYARTLRFEWSPMGCGNVTEHVDWFFARHRQQQVVEKIKQQLSPDSLVLSTDYQDRLKMLKMLNYVDTHDMVTYKGAAARELKFQPVLITELILDGKMDGRAPEEIAALLSATIPVDHRFTPAATLGPDLHIIRRIRSDILETRSRIRAKARAAGGLRVELNDDLCFDWIQVVLLWAKGKGVAEITEETDCQEDLIVRCIQRIEEVIKGATAAANTLAGKNNGPAETALKKAAKLLNRED